MVSYKALNTMIESGRPYACDGIGYRHWGKAATAFESARPYACNGTGYRHWGKAATPTVFASYCISIYFLLNGRKVIT